MTHDSRRYHRTRRPPFARAYGMLGAIGGGLESAAGAVGSGLETAAGSVLGGAGKTALGSLESVGQGIQSLFSGAPSEAGRIAALGQTVPEGVELAGPSATFTGPGFLPSVYQGFVHGPQQFADASAGTSLGQGLGGLLQTFDQLSALGGGHQMQPGASLAPHTMARGIVSGLADRYQGPQVIPGGSPQVAQGPIMSLLKVLGSL